MGHVEGIFRWNGRLGLLCKLYCYNYACKSAVSSPAISHYLMNGSSILDRYIILPNEKNELPMNEKQVESLREKFSWFETDELLKIWQSHNTKEWTKEAFEA